MYWEKNKWERFLVKLDAQNRANNMNNVALKVILALIYALKYISHYLFQEAPI